MAENSGCSAARAQPAESRRHWQYDLIRSRFRIGMIWLMILVLMVMLLPAPGQASLIKVGELKITRCDVRDLALSGSYAYVAECTRYGLMIIDVRDPANPTLTSTYKTTGTAIGVAIDSSYAYVTDSSGLQIIDVRNPGSPLLVGTYTTSGSVYAKSVAIDGSYAYVAAGQAGLLIINVIDPANPTLVATCAVSGANGAMDVALDGSYAYVAAGYELQIIDVRNPASPLLVGTCEHIGVTAAVAVDGSYAYVASGTQGLEIIDVSDPTVPIPVGRYLSSDAADDVALDGSYAYVAGSSSLEIIDVRNPACPTSVSTYTTSGRPKRVALHGSYAYLANARYGLQILAEGATLQGKSWRDLNGDGLQDAGEPGEPNVAVQLLDGSGSPIAGKTATTGNDGSYTFTDLVPGDYYVQFTLPAGMAFSPKDQGTDDSADSDVNSAGQSDKITLDPGQSKSVDAGFYENQIIINEIYPNPVGSDNQAGTASWERVELKNTGSSEFSVGGWTIKDDDSTSALATIPVGTTIPAGGYLVVHIGDGSHGISNNDGDPVILSNSAGIEVDRVVCPKPSSYEGLSYSCIPDASDNWGFWGEPTFGGDLSSSDLPGAPNMADVDYGDAPDIFKTLRSSNGARHFVTGPYLGSSVDSETDGQPSAGADGDGSDEDGAVFSDRIIVGTSSTFTVTASAPGILQTWMDFNGDGDFEDAGEHIASDQSLSAGETKLDFSVPADAKTGDTYARLRFSSASGLACYGSASDGEVEDYLVKITSRYTLGNYVWVDENGNGLQDADEKGLEGVTVNLIDSDGNIVSTQTSTDEGEFLFENPAPGTYNLEFLPPAGYSITSKDAGADDGLDSDADPDTHLAGPITMELGLSDNIWDAGFYLPVYISGIKFQDKNANGQKEDDEPPLLGWEIQLKDSSNKMLQTVTTSSEPGKEGVYEFVDLQPGTYKVSEIQKPGWARTFPQDQNHVVTLDKMGADSINFGNLIASGFSGMKFEDRNGNGAKDSGEPGLASWTIKLMKDGKEVARRETAADGTYSFADIAPGSYTVEEVVQDGWTQSYPVSPGMHPVTLVSGVAGPTDIDFGNYRSTGLSGMKFEDRNGNGARDSGEPGLEGWTIKLKEGIIEVASTQTL
ncbi:MAG: SdrD B-like domain-containing protein, partial [Methanothrix sp.]